MGTLREGLIGAGLAAFRLTRLHHAAAPLTRGRGAILAFHHVRPALPQAFTPNRGLEITPEHLDAVLDHLQHRGYEIVPLDAVPARLEAHSPGRVVALTFDDGYRDTLEHAVPVLERHAAPSTVFVTTGFAERTARLWWLELEAAVARLPVLDVPFAAGSMQLLTRTPAEKARAFAIVAGMLRRAPPTVVASTLDGLGCDAGEGLALVDRLCLDWDGVARLAAHPLTTIGCHTLTHPCLAALDAAAMRHELAVARDAIAERIGGPVHHLAYPYGGAGAAGAREAAAAAELGFTTAVTTRPGVLRARHAGRLTALPRLSVNGLWPDIGSLDVLLSGAPFAARDFLLGAP